MKRDWISTALVLFLVCGTVASAVAGYQCLKASRKFKFLQRQAALVNQNQIAMQELAFDLNQYARRNPAIEPLLEKLNLRMRVGTNAPAPKP